MSRKRKLLSTLLIVTVVLAIAGIGTFAAFYSQTENDGNSFAAGTVYLSDNDAGAALYSVSNQKPGVTTEKCIKVSYGGSLDADVKLHTPDAISAAVGNYTNLVITKGTQATPSFPSCTGFVADAGGAIFTNTLSNFAATHNTAGAGLAANPGAATKWVASDSIVYRFQLTLADDNNANAGNAAGYASGTHKFVWRATNQ
ncbi:MAG TPA: TasA family protein [Solirubrobacteraceae bacterium]|nr:TasA family protein [Solirubrobacteraceae bacterium]